MKKTIFFATILLVVFGIIGVALFARASTPTLSLSSVGGNSVQITVYGDSNSSVILNYPQSGYGSQSQYLGATNYSGYFSTVVALSQYNISSGSYIYVTVNNQQSQSMIWPYATGAYTYGYINFSQNNITLSTNQSASITISGGSEPYSMYSNNSNIFQSVISGSTLTVTGLNYGNGTLSVCSSGYYGGSTGCATLYVNVNSYNYNQQISLGQTNITLNSGNSSAITISGSGNYYISSNSNSSVASANISGNILTVTGNNNGSTNISVCQSNYNNYYNNYNQCATLYVTVNYNNNCYNYGNYYNYNCNNQIPMAVTFSQSNLNINSGQSTSVSIYGGSGGSYYVSHNSNSSAISANINGSTLNITGNQNVVGVIVVCSSSYSCGAVTVTVGYGSYNYNNYDNYNNNYSGNWTYCANENGYCSFSGTRYVRYGANGMYYYKTASYGISCSNSTFGDPAFLTAKQCSYQN